MSNPAPTKAHTATVNRIMLRYEGRPDPTGKHDILTDAMTIDVETSATIEAGLARLSKLTTPAYVALTNREGYREALRLAESTSVGVMNPAGEILKEATPPKKKPRRTP